MFYQKIQVFDINQGRSEGFRHFYLVFKNFIFSISVQYTANILKIWPSHVAEKRILRAFNKFKPYDRFGFNMFERIMLMLEG